jgi:diguanylate cyclase (GGDEF)-like protein
MVTAVIAASAAVSIFVVAVLAARQARAQSERRLAAVLGQLDDHMKAISQSLQSAIERSADMRRRGVGDLALTLELDELLQRLVADAAALTGADAVSVRVKGPGGTPVVASFGTEHGARMLEAALGPPDARPYRALSINWTYGPALEGEAEAAYRSGLVIPIVEDGVESGALAAYARAAGAFLPEHARALGALAEDAASGLTNARRFAEAELSAVTDAVTGVPNRQGYEVELEREVARAGRTGRPLSLVLLDLDDLEEEGARFEPSREELILQEFAGLLTRVTRATDIVCRRGSMEFGVLLPETTANQARQFYLRLRRQAAGTAFTHAGPMTFTAGLVEWRPRETSESLDARASVAVGQAAPDVLEFLPARAASRIDHARAAPPDASRDDRDSVTELSTRGAFRERLAREVAEARSLAQPLALLLMDVGDLRSVDDQLDQAAADRVLADVATRLDDSAHGRGVSCRTDAEELAVIFPRSTVADAESVFAVLQASLRNQPPGDVGQLTLSAGITELSSGDDPDSVLGRASQALWQAKQAGTGTVVVATVDPNARR